MKVPPLPEREEYGSIWRYIKDGEKLVVDGITFEKRARSDKSYWTNSVTIFHDNIITVPVSYLDLGRAGSHKHPIFDRNGTDFEEYHRYSDSTIGNAIGAAELKHKKQWHAKRTEMRKVRKAWEAENQEAVKKIAEKQALVKSAEKTSDILEFAESLTKARAAIDTMLLALERGTFTGQMCADIHWAASGVSEAQRIFRSTHCSKKNK